MCILLALQINAWNQKRQDRDSEQNYLGLLLEDLAKDSLVVRSEIEKQKAKLPAIDSLLAVLHRYFQDLYPIYTDILEDLHRLRARIQVYLEK